MIRSLALGTIIIALVACMKRQCASPELAQHAECERLAALETPQPQP